MENVISAKQTERKSAVRFFALSMAILLVASIFIWGFQTSWGSVEIRRLTLTTPDGNELSTLMYIPKNASTETPAPCAVISHGRSNQGHSNDTWSMELARRGYVVFSPDLSGGGESFVNNDHPTQAQQVVRYALTLDIIDKEHVNLIGYSRGCGTTIETALAFPGQINSVLLVFGPFMISRQAENLAELSEVHIGLLKADCDQYDYMAWGDAEACRSKVAETLGIDTDFPVGEDFDIDENTSFRYVEVSGAMHQTGNISGEAITSIIQFENSFNEAPVERADSDTAWLPQQIFSGIACVTMMFALAALINLLMQTEYFGTMAFARVLRKEQRGAKAWLLDILFVFVIPALLFIKVSTWGMNWFANSKILTSKNLNGIMLWLLVAMFLIGTIRTVYKTLKRKKAGETVALSDFCVAPAGETKFNWSYVGKGLVMAVIVVCFFGLWMTAMEGFMGINYQVWNLSTYLKPSPERIIKSIPYMIIIFVVMASGNINQRVLPSTGNERKDTWIAVAVNTVLTASALFVLLLIQYGGSLILGTGQVPFEGSNGSTGALDFAFGYCYMMGGTTGVVTYIYRKHGNVVPAVITCAVFAGLFTLGSMTLVR